MTQVFALICEFFSKSKFPPIEESVIDVGSVLSFFESVQGFGNCSRSSPRQSSKT